MEKAKESFEIGRVMRKNSMRRCWHGQPWDHQRGLCVIMGRMIREGKKNEREKELTERCACL
jgi:hypothetical protein